MRGITVAVCGLILGAWLLPAVAQSSDDATKALQGAWSATRAERDGKPAADVVGHRLAFTGARFQIRAGDSKPLYQGTFQVEPTARPAVIDFEHTEGTSKGKVWKGIYAVDGDRLTICDNAPDPSKARPTAFEAGPGSGYVLITFTRAKP